MANLPQIPNPITDPYEIASQVIQDTGVEFAGFVTSEMPSKTGYGTQQSRILSGRDGTITRHMVRWFVPETGIVEMYINPQGITYQEKKHISNTRTKGGYVLQYWGEELGTISIHGTTGSSGVEGINVLRDVYRNEQLSFDPYALAVEAESQQTFDPLGINSEFGFMGGGMVTNAMETGSVDATRPRPTLASLAFSVEMYWSGWVFRGYFTDFRVDEKADNLGLFDYTMSFTYTQRRGLRLNFLGWHRSPTDGPSDSSRERMGGVQHSFSMLSKEIFQGGAGGTARTIDQRLKSDRPIMDIVDAVWW